MSHFIKLLNRIRENAGPHWLTPSQHAAYLQVLEKLAFLNELNLFGVNGAGKTFLGWVLAKERVVAYWPRLVDVQEAGVQRNVVVDNSGWHRPEVRRVLRYCRERGYRRVVIISNEPVEDQMAAIEVGLTAQDIRKAAENLRAIQWPVYNDAPPKNLWDLVGCGEG